MITRCNGNDLIFLLGAGATVDAGMPTVAKLTEELKNSLPTLRDHNGVQRPDFGEVFDLFEKYSGADVKNYEKFFEWIQILLKIHEPAFRKVIQTNIPPTQIDAMSDLRLVIGAEIARLLSSRRVKPSYLARLSNFLPNEGRLKVFTLNYDCCIEDACRAAGIDVTTGFDPATKRWKPSIFEKSSQGINLYKLHSSLRWFPVRDKRLSQCKLTLMEFTPDKQQSSTNAFRIPKSPELILGPGPKNQPDDPFLTLLYEFRRVMLNAQSTVIIGYGYGDPHINGIIEDALDAGVFVLNVDSCKPSGKYSTTKNYKHLQSCAKSALLNDLITFEMSKWHQSWKNSTRE